MWSDLSVRVRARVERIDLRIGGALAVRRGVLGATLTGLLAVGVEQGAVRVRLHVGTVRGTLRVRTPRRGGARRAGARGRTGALEEGDSERSEAKVLSEVIRRTMVVYKSD